jgi:hypothetical protein
VTYPNSHPDSESPEAPPHPGREATLESVQLRATITQSVDPADIEAAEMIAATEGITRREVFLRYSRPERAARSRSLQPQEK